MSDATPRRELFGWRMPAITLVGGLLAGAGLAVSFVLLHSNWKQLPWVTPDAESTAPYWVVEGLMPIVVSVGWTGLILHGRGHPRWFALTLALAATEIALLSFSLLPIARAGNGGVWAANVGLPALVLVGLAGPIASMVWPLKSKPIGIWQHLVAAAVLPCAIYVSFESATYALHG